MYILFDFFNKIKHTTSTFKGENLKNATIAIKSYTITIT
nr:hypothetical protein BAR15_100031 [Bartonella sp. AR 15-3]